MRVYQLKEIWGVVLAAENASDVRLALEIDVAGSTGCSFSCNDADVMVAIPPHSQQVLMALTPTPGAGRCTMDIEVTAFPSDVADFPELCEGLHRTLPWQGPPEEFQKPLP